MSVVRRFIRANQAFCARLENVLPTAKGHTFRQYPVAVAECIAAEKLRRIVDVGGGKTCAFAALTPAGWGGKILSLDIAPEELLHNQCVDLRMVSDVTQGLPVQDGALDMITSRSVLEHLADLEAFVVGAARAIRPGGYFIHWVPNKFAPFAVVNAMLPNRIAKKMLHYLDPATKGICGFPVVYDRCYPSAMEKLFAAHGFEVLEVRPSYFQSRYYAFFAPFFLLSTLYEGTMQFFGVRNLCAHYLIVARRTGA